MRDGLDEFHKFSWAGTGSLDTRGKDAPSTVTVDGTAWPRNPVIISDYDPSEDIVVVAVEDRQTEAVIETRPTRDRRSTDVLLNGLRVATIKNYPWLSAADIGQVIL